MTTKTIQTPAGKRISPKQYIALTNRLRHAEPCEHGHFTCAAWDGGPCSNELYANLPLEDQEVED